MELFRNLPFRHSSERFAVVVNLMICVALLYTVYLVGRAIYNISFHPLAALPGPKSRGAFNIPQFWRIWTGDEFSSIKSLHDTYGDVVRIAPNALSFSNAQAWKGMKADLVKEVTPSEDKAMLIDGNQDIYGHRQGKRQVQKDMELYRAGENRVPNIISADDMNHARMRRLLSHAFSESALQEQEPLMTSYFDLLIGKLHDQIEGPTKGKVDIVRWYNFTTFDLIGDLCFGESFQALANEDYHSWIVNIFRGIKILRVFVILRAYPIIGAPAFFLMNFFSSLMKARKKHFAFTREKTEKRLGQETNRRDFMTFIMRHNDEKGMTRPEIIANCGTLIIAGSETTATLLSGATFHLLKNPEAMKKVTNEVRDAFAARTDITFASVAQLPYLNACLKESLRLYPPVPGILPRRTGPEGDVISGQFIPPNTTVGVHQWSAFTSSRNFHNAQTFVPERWLGGDPQYADDDLSAVQPFSVGPRNCLGKNLAYAEMRSILARMLWNFEMQLCEESEKWSEQKVFALWEKPELNIRLRARRSM